MPLKAGIRTTEFWVAALTDCGVVAASAAGVLPSRWAAVAAAVSTFAYSVSRGIAKNGSA